jgi:hypothetical protein
MGYRLDAGKRRAFLEVPGELADRYLAARITFGEAQNRAQASATR